MRWLSWIFKVVIFKKTVDKIKGTDKMSVPSFSNLVLHSIFEIRFSNLSLAPLWATSSAFLSEFLSFSFSCISS